MGGPPDAGGAKNAIQARASTKTYLERYTLKAITGLSEQEDDDDGNGKKGESFEAEALVEQFLKQVRESKTDAEVRQVWGVAAAALRAVKATDGHKQVKAVVESKIADFKAAEAQ